MKTIAEETVTAPAQTLEETPKVDKKAARAPRRAPVAPAKGKAGRKTTPSKKAPTARPKVKGAKPGKDAQPEARTGSKTAKVLDLLKRPSGVTSKELMKATGWQPHSVRGFLSGTVGKKMGLTVVSTRNEDGERTYSVEA